jgi:hypothetical protein
MSDLELGLKQLNYYGYRMTAYSHFSRCELPGLWTCIDLRLMEMVNMMH